MRCYRPPSLVMLAFPGMGPATARKLREKEELKQRVSVGFRPLGNLGHATNNPLEGQAGSLIAKGFCRLEATQDGACARKSRKESRE